MTKLEDFERAASDPNRFFVKGKFTAFFSVIPYLIGGGQKLPNSLQTFVKFSNFTKLYLRYFPERFSQKNTIIPISSKPKTFKRVCNSGPGTRI